MSISGLHTHTRHLSEHPGAHTCEHAYYTHEHIPHNHIHGGGGAVWQKTTIKIKWSSLASQEVITNTIPKGCLWVCLVQRQNHRRAAAADGQHGSHSWLHSVMEPACNEHPEAVFITFLHKAERGPRRITTWQNKLHMWPKYWMVHCSVPASWEGKADPWA